MPLTREDEQRAAKAKIEKDYQNRNTFGFSGKQVIDLEKIGGYKENLFYKAKEGYNRIDILPYLVATNHHPQKVEKGLPDYVLDLWVHRKIGPAKSNYLCLQKMMGMACPICEEQDELYKDPDTTKKELDELKPKHRCFYCVVDLDLPEDKQTIQLFEESHYLFGKHLLSATITRSGEYVPFFDRETGKSIEFQVEKVSSPEGTYFNYKQFSFIEREPYPMEIYDQTFALDELLITPSYEEVRNAHMGLEEGEEPVSAKEQKTSTPVETSGRSGGLRGGSGGVRGGSVQREEAPVDEAQEQRKKEGEALFDDKKEEPAKVTAGRGVRKRGVRNKEPETNSVENPCPFGHVFGKDNDSIPGDCAKCEQDVWDKCSAEFDELAKKHQK